MRVLILSLFFFSCQPSFADIYIPTYAVQNVNSSTTISHTAYLQLVASTGSSCNQIQVYNSSPVAMVLAIGAAGLEQQIPYYFPPQTNASVINLRIGPGVRLSVEAITTNATTGLFILNCLQ